MENLDPHSPIPLYHQIEQAVGRLILEERLSPGTRLPSEPDLAVRFGVAPLTVRKALERLERDGVVVRRRGSGTFVGPNPPVRPPDAPPRVGFVLHDPNSPLLLGLMHAIESTLRVNGTQMVVLFGRFSDQIECERIQEAVQSGARGLILWSMCGPEARALIARLSASGFPLVLVDRCPPGLEIDCVLVDDISGAQAAADHLLTLGHRRFAFIYGPEELELSSIQARLTGLRTAAADLPVTLWHHPDMVSQENLESSLRLASRILSSPNSPGAWFCVNDALAQAMVVSLARLGVKVPDQVSVTGFDGMQYLSTGLRLTTVRRDADQMGREAVRLLLERCSNPALPQRRIVLPVELSPGETTGWYKGG